MFNVMAHYDGGTLKQKLEAGPLDVDDALWIATQVAEGLALLTVTHSEPFAAALSAHVLKLEGGRVTEASIIEGQTQT